MNTPTIAEVDLSAIRDNIEAIRARVGPRPQIIPAVKANAYGNGAVAVSRACLQAGADVLGVARLEEAIELREAGVDAPILVFGCSEPAAAADIVEYRNCLGVLRPGLRPRASEAARKLGKPALVQSRWTRAWDHRGALG